jgi:hypothetical protein
MPELQFTDNYSKGSISFDTAFPVTRYLEPSVLIRLF